MAKPVIPRATARQDVEDAVEHYAREAGNDVILRFIDALSDAYDAIAKLPQGSSPRWAYELMYRVCAVESSNAFPI